MNVKIKWYYEIMSGLKGFKIVFCIYLKLVYIFYKYFYNDILLWWILNNICLNICDFLIKILILVKFS